jgi:glycine cleavage system protein P-like pyridoxal-binding family
MKGKNWYGVAPNPIRAYAWVMSLGAGGLRGVAEVAVLKHNRRSNALCHLCDHRSSGPDDVDGGRAIARSAPTP